MKRLLSIFLFLLYTLTAEGIQVTRHFCCGTLAAITLHKTNEEDCCGVKKCKDCYDDHVVIKLKEDHVQSHHIHALGKVISDHVVFVKSCWLTLSPTIVLKRDEVICISKSFSSSSPPIYLFDCSWLI